MTTIAQQNERESLIQLASTMPADFSNRPGRYDGASDRKLAIALDFLDSPDEEAGSVATTGLHLARFGRFVRTTDTQGFVDVKACETIPEAEALIAEVVEVEHQLDEMLATESDAAALATYGEHERRIAVARERGMAEGVRPQDGDPRPERTFAETARDQMFTSFAAAIEADQAFDRACRERVLGAR